MTIHLPLITTSELRSFRRCKREHHLNYRLGYREIHKAGPLRFGTAIHNALEVWWSPATLGNFEAALAAIDSNGEIDEYERAKARAMMAAYHARWVDAEFEVLGVEMQFEAPLVHPITKEVSNKFSVGGKMDAFIRMPNGDVFLTEHKTVSVDVGVDTPYWRRLRIDPQISTYYLGLRALGYEPRGCLYDVLRKPVIKPLKATPVESRKYTQPTKKDPVSRLYANQREFDETPEEYEARCLSVIIEEPDRYLFRGEVTRLESDELDAAQDMWDTARELEEAELARRYPRNPDACERYSRMCSFFGVCTGSESLEDENLFRRNTRKHEELAP